MPLSGCVRSVLLSEAKRDIARSDATQRMRLRRAVLPEAERKVERNIDTQKKRLKRATLTQFERKIARNVEARRKRYNIEEGPLLLFADRDLVGIARRPVINNVVLRYSLGDMCFTCPYCNAVFLAPNKEAAQSPRFSVQNVAVTVVWQKF